MKRPNVPASRALRSPAARRFSYHLSDPPLEVVDGGAGAQDEAASAATTPDGATLLQLAHDVRSPLSTIVLLCELMQRTAGKDNPALSSQLETVLAAARRVSQLVDVGVAEVEHRE